jgi:hypothetical protein
VLDVEYCRSLKRGALLLSADATRRGARFVRLYRLLSWPRPWPTLAHIALQTLGSLEKSKLSFFCLPHAKEFCFTRLAPNTKGPEGGGAGRPAFAPDAEFRTNSTKRVMLFRVPQKHSKNKRRCYEENSHTSTLADHIK